jgi:hypothetical protein
MFKISFILLLFVIVILFQKGVRSQQCGVSIVGRGNIVGGNYVSHGQFPWFATIMKLDNKGEAKYQCGGTLISNKLVLTGKFFKIKKFIKLNTFFEAAHCILNKKEYQPLLAREIAIILGGHNLKSFIEEGRETKFPSKIHIHPDWNPHIETFDADIALLELPKPVTYSSYIQPICLWESPFEPPQDLGVVVGYGKSEDSTKIHENIPKVIDVPIQTQENCFLSNPALVSISSTRTFCGGYRGGTGVCNGDSGGGLVIQLNNVFYLRGIVSSSLIRDFSCDLENYSIFTNVLKFKNWIKSFYSESHITSTKRKSYDECGVMSSSSGLIQKGKFSSKSEFPWMASIVVNFGFNSSGALISRKHVVTRAQAVGYWNDDKTKFTAIITSRIKIYLGSLQHVSDQNVFNAQEIILHPNIKGVDEAQTNNIAIIVLSSSVEFSDFIRPVCLWTFSDDLNLIENLPIYAVGYGNDENGIVTNVRKHAKVILMDQNECEEKYSKWLKNFLSENKAFCVIGDDNGSPCEYDECLFVKFNGKWYLRGIYIRSWIYPNGSCYVGPSKPFLYHDIATNIKWIENIIKL